MSEWKELKKEIEVTLNEEKENLMIQDSGVVGCMGTIPILSHKVAVATPVIVSLLYPLEWVCKVRWLLSLDK